MEEADSRELVAAAEDRLRRTVAQSLHDDVQQHLHSLRVVIGLLEDRVRSGTAVDLESLQDLARRTEDALAAVRHAVEIVGGDATDVVASLQRVVRRAGELHGLTVDLDIDVAAGLDAVIVDELTAVAAELLFNVAKHTSARRAGVTLRDRGAEVILEVSDPGPWSGAGSAPTGFGLTSLRRRLALIGGSIERRAEDAATTVVVRLPRALPRHSADTAGET